jgi:hypothetical protein
VGESSIYQSYIFGSPDHTFTLAVTNGNYTVRELVGVTNRGGSNNTQQSVLQPYYASSAIYTAQDTVQRWAFCAYCEDNYQAQQPVDVTVYAHVTDGMLRLGAYGYSPSRWLGWDKTEKGGTGYTFLSGLQIAQDATTVPHWEIGSYVPGAGGGARYSTPQGTIVGQGDTFTIPLSNGTAYVATGAPQPGILQLYVRDVFTGVSDVQWSLSGPGTLTAAGIYTAPTVMPSGCATVKAQSASQPSIVASRQICFTTN